MAGTRIEPIDKDIDLIISEMLSPKAQAAAFADFARETLAEVEAKNAEVLGYVPKHETFVDGHEGVSENAVRTNGTIVYVFDIIQDLFLWVDDQLRTHSPVGSGRYRGAHMFFADGVEADPTNPPVAGEYAFINSLPYARKIEYGESPQAPDGVYEAVTALAARRYGNVAKIQFTWRAVLPGGGNTMPAQRGTSHARAQNKSAVRYPAIIITPR